MGTKRRSAQLLMIQHGIEVPPPRMGRAQRAVWALGPGDSYLLRGTATKGQANTYLRAARSIGIKVTTRREANGTRLWRVYE